MAIAPDYSAGLTNLGALLQHRGYLQESIALYEQLLSHEPDNIEVRCNLAKALTDIGANARALAECQQAVDDSGQHPYALATLGAVQLDLENYNEARTALEKAIQADPHDDMALVNLAVACYQLDDLETATTLLRSAVEINPWNARAVADLANALSATGSVEEALALCRAFLQQHPGERLVVAALALALHNAGQTETALELTDFHKLVQVHALPTSAEYSSIEDFNTTLSQLMRQNPSLTTNPVSKSTAGGDQTGELDLQSDPALTLLANAINAAVNAAANQYRTDGLDAHPVMAPAADRWMTRCWGTVLREGGQQTPHMHPLGWLSGIYYPHLPTDMGQADAEAGWLEFGALPDRFFRTTEPPRWRHQPQPGELIIFPSWFWHQTLPFQSADERISIAFDIMPQSSLQML